MVATLTARVPIACVLLQISVAAAQALPDPTLPPAVARGTTDSPAPLQPKLQMILRDRGDVLRALVDGQWVRAGDVLPGSALRVVRVTDSSVELARGDVTEILDLLPANARRAVTSRARTAHSTATERP